MKYLLVLAVLVIAWHVWRRGQVPPSAGTRAPQRSLNAPEPMVHCAFCQVLVPQSDAITSRGRIYCSREHAQADDVDNTSPPTP